MSEDTRDLTRGALPGRRALPIWRQVLQTTAGVAVWLALGFSWLFVLSLWNRITILRDKDNYRSEAFIVRDAVYLPNDGDELADSYWLLGMVANRQERLVPKRRGLPPPTSAAELLQRYPKGTVVPVYYNPRATTTIVQGETLRVIEAHGDFWNQEAKLLRKLARLVLIPFPAAIAVYVTIRFFNRRHLTIGHVQGESTTAAR